jgi:hypothetical protein
MRNAVPVLQTARGTFIEHRTPLRNYLVKLLSPQIHGAELPRGGGPKLGAAGGGFRWYTTYSHFVSQVATAPTLSHLSACYACQKVTRTAHSV